MADWIKTDINFNSRLALIRLSEFRVQEILIETGKSNMRHGDPDLLAQWLKELIEFDAPQLQGLTVLGLRIDYARLCWEAICEHPTFDVHRPGEELPEIAIQKR